MKPTFFRILLSAAFCIALLSCSDDDDKKKSNEFTVQSVTVPILEGSYTVYENEDTDGNIVHEWDIELQGETEQKSGQILFTLYHSDGSSITPGTYTFDGDKLRSSFTFYDIYAETFDVASGNYLPYEYDIKSGTIKVEKSGDTYTFTVDAVFEGDISIKGYYKGALERD
jgi:hypothetical protein